MVKRVIKMFYSEIRGLHQAAYILALFAFGSQMLALVRDRMLAHQFGAGSELDIYYAAFRIPDLLFVLFASVLSVYVLLPFVTKAKEDGANVLAQVFTLFLYVYVAVALLVFIAAPWLAPILFPGLASESESLVLLLRILLLQPLLLGISSLLGVVTQLSHRFVIYAISPLVYNLGIIFGIAVLYPFMGLSGLAVGVVLGAFGHMIIQWPLVYRSEHSFGLVRKINFSLIWSVLLVAMPRALTLSIHQIVILFLIALATTLEAGSVSVFQFAFNLQSVPLAIIGMSYSVAAFPVLADLFAKSRHEEFTAHLLTAFRHIIFWSFPIIALVIVLRAQIVRVVLGSGEFDWSDTRLTAAVLALFIVGLVAQSILLLLNRAFYACGNARTPLWVALVGAATSISSAFFFLHYFTTNDSLRELVEGAFRLVGVSGTEVVVLAAAFVVGVMLEVIILVYLITKTFSVNWSSFGRQMVQSITAAMVAAFASYATLVFVVDGINQETFIGIMLQGSVAGLVGVAGAILTYYALGSKELNEIYRSFHAKIFKTDVIAPQSDTL
jgi:putative peptidoglycan lipid II flippase